MLLFIFTQLHLLFFPQFFWARSLHKLILNMIGFIFRIHTIHSTKILECLICTRQCHVHRFIHVTIARMVLQPTGFDWPSLGRLWGPRMGWGEVTGLGRGREVPGRQGSQFLSHLRQSYSVNIVVFCLNCHFIKEFQAKKKKKF